MPTRDSSDRFPEYVIPIVLFSTCSISYVIAFFLILVLLLTGGSGVPNYYFNMATSFFLLPTAVLIFCKTPFRAIVNITASFSMCVAYFWYFIVEIGLLREFILSRSIGVVLIGLIYVVGVLVSLKQFYMDQRHKPGIITALILIIPTALLMGYSFWSSFGGARPGPQKLLSVNLTAYPEPKDTEVPILSDQTFAVLNSPSPSDIALDNEIKAKLERMLVLKGFKISDPENADYVMLPIYGSQSSGNEWCAESLHESYDSSNKIRDCQKIRYAHPYLWSVHLKIFEREKYEQVKELPRWWLRQDTAWTIDGVSKVRVKNYKEVVDYILIAIIKHFDWHVISYKTFTLDADKDKFVRGA